MNVVVLLILIFHHSRATRDRALNLRFNRDVFQRRLNFFFRSRFYLRRVDKGKISNEQIKHLNNCSPRNFLLQCLLVRRRRSRNGAKLAKFSHPTVLAAISFRSSWSWKNSEVKKTLSIFLRQQKVFSLFYLKMSLQWNFWKISNSHLHFWCGINGSSLAEEAWNFSVKFTPPKTLTGKIIFSSIFLFVVLLIHNIEKENL